MTLKMKAESELVYRYYLVNQLVRTITTRTLLDGTLTVTVIPTLRPTLALLQQRLYRT